MNQFEKPHIPNIWKPPLGCTPHKVWLEERRDVLLGCIQRYGEQNFKIPHKWFVELNQIIEKINNTEGLDIE